MILNTRSYVTLGCAVGVFLWVSWVLFDGSLIKMHTTADYPMILVINALVGGSVALLVLELRWDALRVVGAVGAALLIGYVITVLFSLDSDNAFAAANAAYDALLSGPLSRPNRWGVWIQDALTLILVGLALIVVFEARQFSLGAEGQIYFGALLSGVIVLFVGDLPAVIVVPLAVLGAMTAGFLWGLLPGALKAYLGANELVSTLMLNVIALRVYEMVLTYQLKPDDVGFIASASFASSGTLTPIIRGTQVTTGVFLVIAAVFISWVLLRRTTFGYEIRMIGANSTFAAYGGVPVARTMMLVMAVSGAVAGLAGAHLGMGIHRRLILNLSFGLAFDGVVVALLARNNVLVAPFAGLMYAYLRTGAQFMERDTDVSFEVVRIIQAVIILFITADALTRALRQRT